MSSRSIEVGRRAVIAGLGAIASVPCAWAAGGDDATLRRALDSIDTKAPQAGLASLGAFAGNRLSPGAAIDLDTVRAGLSVDVRLATAVGPDRYALQIERRLGEAIPPAAAHALLEREVQALTVRADRHLRRLGFAHGSTGSRFVAAFAETRFLYPDSPAGRDEAVTDMNRTLDAARTRLAAEYARVPGFTLDVSVRRMSTTDEVARRGGYRVLPTPRSSGAYYVDLADIARRPRWSLASVVRHELLPGHMLQLPLEALAAPHPLRLEYLSAFPEGWAIYAEEASSREDGAWDALGTLHWLLFRALRGLADTGIHFAHWPPDRTRALFEEAQGVASYFAPFDGDLERVAREPGVRAAEALCWLRIRGLRHSCAHRLSARKFHTIVLENGRQRIARLARKTEN